jgi:hypothetical protein
MYEYFCSWECVHMWISVSRAQKTKRACCPLLMHRLRYPKVLLFKSRNHKDRNMIIDKEIFHLLVFLCIFPLWGFRFFLCDWCTYVMPCQYLVQIIKFSFSVTVLSYSESPQLLDLLLALVLHIDLVNTWAFQFGDWSLSVLGNFFESSCWISSIFSNILIFSFWSLYYLLHSLYQYYIICTSFTLFLWFPSWTSWNIP